MPCELCSAPGTLRPDLQAKSVACDNHYSILSKLEQNRDTFFRVRDRIRGPLKVNEMGVPIWVEELGHMGKIRTRNITRKALQSGRLKKQPCQVCGDPNIQIHHVNYYDPFDVRYLCKNHHLDAHRVLKGQSPKFSTADVFSMKMKSV